jgi:hypothetical protein
MTTTFTHWTDDATDLDWRNYSAGWDVGRAAAMKCETVDLAGHGEAFTDGFADGWQEGQGW